MGVKRVNPENGKYSIKGKDKNGRDKTIDLTLDAPRLDDYIVEQIDGEDMKSKHPDSTPEGVDWFACFSIYNKGSGNAKGDPATVNYSFPVTLLPNQRFFVAYNKKDYEDITDQIRNGTVRLNRGDPATGTVP